MERAVRCLLAWMSEQEGTTILLGHIPGLDEQVTTQKDAWEVAQRGMEARQPYDLPTPTILPLPAELLERGNVFLQRADVLAVFHGLDWSLGFVDLNQVLSFQKIVVEEAAIERVESSITGGDLHSLFSFCLPEPAAATGLPGSLDHDQKAVTFSSLNPNLRVGGHVIMDADIAAAPGLPSQKHRLIGFTINFGVPFVQVAEYGGRWFVRDGYHRCYGLLRRGIFQVPCVFIRCRNFEELGAANPGFFPYEILFGDRPPFLRDFLDDSVSATTKQLAQRKVIRISAEEFIVTV